MKSTSDMAAPTPDQIREVNTRYHDAAASSYDSKWAIDYGEIGAEQVLMKLGKALGRPPGHYPRALEVGAGTGYFTINLARACVIGEATATDISAGMLRRLAATAAELGVEVATVQTDAERLPFDDESFDLVLGHAILHHLPDLGRALSEFRRVLVPGGTLAFMGEPSRYGDQLASLPKRLGMLAAPAWRRLVSADRLGGRTDETPSDTHDLEQFVDVHTFAPGDLRRLAEDAGLRDVRVRGEELLASMYGWMLRSLESRTSPESVPRAWHQFAFRSYLTLQWLDGHLLEPRLPPQLFYNLLLSAIKPDEP